MKWKRIWISLWLLTLLAVFIVTLINRLPYFLLGGSSSVSPVMEELLTKYPENHKNGDFNYVSSASAGAPPRVEKNIFGIGWLSENYQVDKAEKPDLIDFQMMRDGLVIVYNIPDKYFNNKSILNFTPEILYSLYVLNYSWNEAFPDVFTTTIEAKTYTRPNGSGTRKVFDDEALQTEKYYQANTVDSSGAMLNLDFGSIGYTSFADYSQARNISVKAGTWNGVPANYNNIESNTYKLWRPFTGLINKKYKYKTDIADFLRWIFSEKDEVNEIFKKFGPKINLTDEVNEDLVAWLTEN